MCIRDSAFTDQIDKVLAEPQLADAIGKEAWKLVRARHTNSDIIKELVAFYASLAKT